MIDGRLYLATWERGIWSLPAALVLRRKQVISPDIPNEISVGAEVVPATTTRTSPSYAVVSGPATVSGYRLVATGEGVVVVEISQAGEDQFQPARILVSLQVQNDRRSILILCVGCCM